jgi:hypothetical protein
VDPSPDRVIQKTINLVYAASPLSIQLQGVRFKAGWPGIRKKRLSGGHVYPQTVVLMS